MRQTCRGASIDPVADAIHNSRNDDAHGGPVTGSGRIERQVELKIKWTPESRQFPGRRASSAQYRGAAQRLRQRLRMGRSSVSAPSSHQEGGCHTFALRLKPGSEPLGVAGDSENLIHRPLARFFDRPKARSPRRGDQSSAGYNFLLNRPGEGGSIFLLLSVSPLRGSW